MKQFCPWHIISLFFLLLVHGVSCAERNSGNESVRADFFTESHHQNKKKSLHNKEVYTNGSFEVGKMDIYNRYIEDIKYEIIPTSKSIVAIGEKLIIEHQNSKDSGSEDLNSVLEKMLLEEEASKGKKKNDDIVVKKIHSKSMILIPVYFKDLTSWDKDNHDHALESFLNSCKVMVSYVRKGRNIKSSEMQFGNIQDWYQTCLDAVKYGKSDRSKSFFEDSFIPFLVYDKTRESSAGSFTGYNEFSVKGSTNKTSKYKYPIYFRPNTCINSKTCPTRSEIYNGILNGLGLEICWIDNPMDLFRMQLQGSGIVVLKNYKFLRISFSGTNQHKNKNIWSHFDASKFLPQGSRGKNDVNRWLYNNPKQAEKLLSNNPSYTFFTLNNRRYAIGSSGSGLTPSRSIAVDPRYIPYGMPMWIETKLPVKDINDSDNKRWINLHRLTVAQDTGVAIKGAIRADIFFGHGDKASYLAHHTHFDGSYYMLIPKRAVQNIKILEK